MYEARFARAASGGSWGCCPLTTSEDKDVVDEVQHIYHVTRGKIRSPR